MPQDGNSPIADRTGLIAALTDIVGAANVSSAAETIALHAADIWSAGAGSILAVVSPTSLDTLSGAVAAIGRAGLAIAPRGAGMSYTGGYVPVEPDTVSLDLSRMNRILAISPDDMTVTVEAGCSLGGPQRGARATRPAHAVLGADVRPESRPSAAACRS